jgi:hypothetical protein
MDNYSWTSLVSVIAPTLVLSETGRFIHMTFVGAPNTSELPCKRSHRHSGDT